MDKVNDVHQPLTVTRANSKPMLSLKDYDAIAEIAYLLSISGIEGFL